MKELSRPLSAQTTKFSDMACRQRRHPSHLHTAMLILHVAQKPENILELFFALGAVKLARPARLAHSFHQTLLHDIPAHVGLLEMERQLRDYIEIPTTGAAHAIAAAAVALHAARCHLAGQRVGALILGIALVGTHMFEADFHARVERALHAVVDGLLKALVPALNSDPGGAVEHVHAVGADSADDVTGGDGAVVVEIVVARNAAQVGVAALGDLVQEVERRERRACSLRGEDTSI